MYDMEKEEAQNVADFLDAGYDVENLTVVTSRGGYCVRFQFELGGLTVEAEVHEYDDEADSDIDSILAGTDGEDREEQTERDTSSCQG